MGSDDLRERGGSGESVAEDGAVLDAAFEMASADVLTAWRVRNAALAVAATFVHPGPDWEDEQARKRLVEEWVSDGHDQVAEENRQRLVAIQRMIAAERESERLREALLRITSAPSSWLDADGPVRRIAKSALAAPSSSEGGGG